MNDYFIFTNNKKKGPYKIEELELLDINQETLIWRKGMGKWKKAKVLFKLDGVVGNIPPPIPIQNNNGFKLYLKKNYKIIILAFGISLLWVIIFTKNTSIIQ